MDQVAGNKYLSIMNLTMQEVGRNPQVGQRIKVQAIVTPLLRSSITI
jgi:hypothetical protein